MKKLNGFAPSWFFAPYIGSADLDFFKRIKDTDFSYTVVQVARDARDDGIMAFASAPIKRIEVKDADHTQPRTRDARAKFIEGVVKAFEESNEKFDFIISHSNELVSHEAAAAIKKKHPEMPWISYFGDLFIKNPYVKYIAGYPLIEEDCAIERATLRNADLVILNNEYQRDLMFTGDLAALKAKAVVVPHCFDQKMYRAPRERGDEKFVFSHLGTLYHVKRTAEPVLKAVDRLLEIYPEYKGRFELRFYGGAPCENDRAAHSSMRHPSHVSFLGPVAYSESLRLMAEADALLLIDGMFTREEDGLDCNPFFPGKLTDYMGARKPIASITMAKGPTADIMVKAKNLVADSRLDRIAYVLKRYIDKKINPDYSVYEEYSVERVSRLMEDAIRSVIKV
ncbi:MAG: glycosyltransferase family 4 protein [Pseudomonadales bacterium]|jgi:hypothetical protein|uniref:Glycosyltransferase subfamily 4-like N-terminal domain-containing protein n=1 Tax=Achromobacter kerstersii TaxID=1353890 RepID=A0A6S7A570_9BURK|nr:glycosyltransferase family 4 protein [Achromobacter kerstersii]CAB3713584.1 hypothetical protein LMG3441_03274 [Achromobacter kerstersii]